MADSSSIASGATISSDLLSSLVNESYVAGLNFTGGWFGTEHNADIAADQQQRSFLQQWLLNNQMRDIQKELTDYGFEVSKEATQWQNENLPSFARRGLQLAGYNPILAVNSAGGQSFSQQIPGASTSHAPSAHSSGQSFNSGVSVLDGMARLAAIRQTNAQTDLIKKRELGEGWTIKTLSAGEARGLGASLLGKLGFNFNGSEHQTFLVAYNPITGELRNLGDTKNGLGTTGEPTSSVDVVPVDWKTDKSPSYKFNPDDWELKPEYQR